MPWYVCRDQRTTCGSGFSPSTTWVSGAGFTCIGLKVSTFFHSLSHLASLTLFFKTGFLGGTLDLPIHLSWLVTKSRRSTCLCLSYSPRIHLSLPLPPCPQDPPVSAPPPFPQDPPVSASSALGLQGVPCVTLPGLFTGVLGIDLMSSCL